MVNPLQTNIEKARQAREAVNKHCMAARVHETKSHLLVIFPLGFRLDGVRVSMANGVAWACDKALAKMEETWRAS